MQNSEKQISIVTCRTPTYRSPSLPAELLCTDLLRYLTHAVLPCIVHTEFNLFFFFYIVKPWYAAHSNYLNSSGKGGGGVSAHNSNKRKHLAQKTVGLESNIQVKIDVFQPGVPC